MRYARFLGGVAIVGCLLVLPQRSQAQADPYPFYFTGAEVVAWPRYTPKIITTNVPTTVLASATATNEIVIDVRDVETLGAFLSASLIATNPAAAALILPYTISIDGTNFTDAAVGSISLSLTGTVVKASATNINVDNWGWLKITGFQNTGTNNLATNGIKLQVVAKSTSLRTRSR